MDLENFKKFIESVAFFKEFSDHEKNKLAGDRNTFKQFQKGSNIFIQGDNGSSLFIVLLGSIELIKICDAVGQEGRVSLKKEEEKTVGELETGSVFGEISMLTGRKRSVTARVVSAKAVVMEISDRLVEGLIPSIQAKFHKQLLVTIVQDLGDINVRYMKLQSNVGVVTGLS